MKFDGFLLVSDLDNTLIDYNHSISEENICAIRYFMENGGYFTAATGRTAYAAERYLSITGSNAAAILNNGAKLYDYANKEIIFEKFIARERKEAMRIMHEKYPFLGFEVYINDVGYIYSECSETKRLEERKHPFVMGLPDELWDADWTKILMIAESDVLDIYEPIYRQYDKGYAVRSGAKFFDIVSDGVSKGKALNILAERLGIEKDKVIAVGDNMNDIDLLKAAGRKYAVENAVDEIKKTADVIAPPCDKSAIAWIIENIEKNI